MQKLEKGKKCVLHMLETCLQDWAGGVTEGEGCWSEQLVAIRVCGQALFTDVTAIQKPET